MIMLGCVTADFGRCFPAFRRPTNLKKWVIMPCILVENKLCEIRY